MMRAPTVILGGDPTRPPIGQATAFHALEDHGGALAISAHQASYTARSLHIDGNRITGAVYIGSGVDYGSVTP